MKHVLKLTDHALSALDKKTTFGLAIAKNLVFHHKERQEAGATSREAAQAVLSDISPDHTMSIIEHLLDLISDIDAESLILKDMAGSPATVIDNYLVSDAPASTYSEFKKDARQYVELVKAACNDSQTIRNQYHLDD